MDIKIRKATEDDAAFIAWAILKGSRSGKKVGLFDLIFQNSDSDTLSKHLIALTLSTTKSFCHFSNFLIAEESGNTVGALCGYEPRIATQEMLSEALEGLGVDEAYKERIASYLLCMPELDRQTWVLDFMQVKDEAHELTVLKELVQKSLLTARLKGYRKAETMIEIGEAEQKISYEKLGFKFLDEKRSDYYFETFGRKGIMRLSMQL